MEFLHNPLVTLFIGVIASFLISVIINRYFTNKYKPVYTIRSTILIKNLTSKIDKLNVLYDNEKIENLTISRFMLLNKGSAPLLQEQVADDIVIKINEEHNILDVILQCTTNKSNEISFDNDGDKIRISFKYLAPKDGFVLIITHTGSKSDDFKVCGNFISGKKLKKINIAHDDKKAEGSKSNIFAIIWFTLIILLTLFMLFGDENEGVNKYVMFGMGLLAFLPNLLINIRSIIPKKLDIFYSDDLS